MDYDTSYRMKDRTAFVQHIMSQIESGLMARGWFISTPLKWDMQLDRSVGYSGSGCYTLRISLGQQLIVSQTIEEEVFETFKGGEKLFLHSIIDKMMVTMMLQSDKWGTHHGP